MFEGMSDATLLRIGIAVAAVLLMLAIPFISRGKPGQGTRNAAPPKPAANHLRQEPTLREILEAEAADAPAPAPADEELKRMEGALESRAPAAGEPAGQGAR